MSCYECAIRGESVPAVATCTHCGVGMCVKHLGMALDYRVGGTTYGCRHDLSAAVRASRPAGVAHSNGHTRHRLRAAR
jgi:hypothetical protein